MERLEIGPDETLVALLVLRPAVAHRYLWHGDPLYIYIAAIGWSGPAADVVEIRSSQPALALAIATTGMIGVCVPHTGADRMINSL